MRASSEPISQSTRLKEMPGMQVSGRPAVARARLRSLHPTSHRPPIAFFASGEEEDVRAKLWALSKRAGEGVESKGSAGVGRRAATREKEGCEERKDVG